MSITEDNDDRRNQSSDGRHLVALASKGSHRQSHAPRWKDTGYELYKSVFEPLLPAMREATFHCTGRGTK
jgi:hypothetical protein